MSERTLSRMGVLSDEGDETRPDRHKAPAQLPNRPLSLHVAWPHPHLPPAMRGQVKSIQKMVGRRNALLFVVLFCTLLGLTPLLIVGGMTVGFSVLLGGVVVLALTIVLVRWPSLGLFVVAGCVFLFEQEPLSTPILTDNLYIFHWPVQLEGFVERPIGVLILFALLVWVIHRLARRRRLLRGGALLIPFSLFMLCVVGGAAYGLASGGDLKIIVVQFRPFWYLFVSYLMAYNFLMRKRDVRAFFWFAILCGGVKAVQGLYVYLLVWHGVLQVDNTILSHEESFFFAALILLVIILLMCRGGMKWQERASISAVGTRVANQSAKDTPGADKSAVGTINRPLRGGTMTDTWRGARRQLLVALFLLPMVVVAMVANQRRTDYVALLVGVGVVWVLVFLIRPRARKRLVVGLLVCLVLGGGYVVAFAHSSGTLGEPARGILSVFSPSTSDTRDASSNLYRVYEDNDLKYTVKQHPLGLGFGKPFLQPEPLTSIFPGILSVDPYYNYVPHNTIYWVWVDLGPIGYLALWLLVGSIIVRGCVIVRQLRDGYLQVVAIYVVAVTFMEVVVAFADYQLFFYRNVIYLGLLCGMLVKLPMLDSEASQAGQAQGPHPTTQPPPVPTFRLAHPSTTTSREGMGREVVRHEGLPTKGFSPLDVEKCAGESQESGYRQGEGEMYI